MMASSRWVAYLVCLRVKLLVFVTAASRRNIVNFLVMDFVVVTMIDCLNLLSIDVGLHKHKAAGQSARRE